MSILAVTAPVARRGLTAIATVKRELGITGSADHEFLEDLILQATAAIGFGDLRQGGVPMIPERIAALIAQFGQPVTLQRLTGTTTQVRHEVVCQAIVRGYEPVQLIGGITQGDRQVAISNAEIAHAQWPGPPLRDRRAHHHHPGLRHPQAPR